MDKSKTDQAIAKELEKQIAELQSASDFYGVAGRD